MQFGGFLDDLVNQTQGRIQEILGQKIEKGLDKLSGQSTPVRTEVGVVGPDVPSEVARQTNNQINGVFSSKIAGIPLWAVLGGLAVGTYFLVRKK